MSASHGFVLAGLLTLCACVAPVPGDEAVDGPLVVRSAAQLSDALQPVNAGRRIQVMRGEILITQPLLVPDGATLEGEGVMQLDAEGIPGGFAPGTETTLRVAAGFDGNVLTLGHGSVVKGLRVVDLANTASQPSLRRGNVVYVASRSAGDTVTASVIECELVTPIAAGFTDAGPHGHALVVLTLNPALGAPPAAHEGAQLSLRVQRSITRTHTGAALFANNFAALGNVVARLEGNRFEGYLTAAGGVSRPDAVTFASTRIESRRNLYVRAGLDRYGWLLLGGSTSPHFMEAGIPGASHVALRIDSKDDRIEGFRVGIQAAAAGRLGPDSAPLSDNRLEMTLEGTRIRSVGEGAADLVLRAAASELGRAGGLGDFPPGDRNILRMEIRDVTGGGPRRNVFAHVTGPAQPANQGTGNRLEIVGDAALFGQSTRDIDPPPDARFFVIRR